MARNQDDEKIVRAFYDLFEVPENYQSKKKINIATTSQAHTALKMFAEDHGFSMFGAGVVVIREGIISILKQEAIQKNKLKRIRE